MANLVDNALKYTPSGGRVTIHCGVGNEKSLCGAQPFVEVEDNGLGVSAQERERVFEPFYRIHGSLGLAIADEIARLHHSHLQFDTGARGFGLRVSLYLPL
jgi:two-component system, OmpR family, sensor histidine kinase TctE